MEFAKIASDTRMLRALSILWKIAVASRTEKLA